MTYNCNMKKTEHMPAIAERSVQTDTRCGMEAHGDG